MGNMIFLFWMACIHKPEITTPIIEVSPSIGSVDAREYILIAYLAQYNKNTERSMKAFENAWKADPTCTSILLLWGDSAWEQGLTEEARRAWKEYKQTLSTDDTTELQKVQERLERT